MKLIDLTVPVWPICLDRIGIYRNLLSNGPLYASDIHRNSLPNGPISLHVFGIHRNSLINWAHLFA